MTAEAEVKEQGGAGLLCLDGALVLLLLLHLEEKGAFDVWQNTAESNGGADERVELFVTADGELEVTRRDALDLQVLGRVLCMERRVSVFSSIG